MEEQVGRESNKTVQNFLYPFYLQLWFSWAVFTICYYFSLDPYLVNEGVDPNTPVFVWILGLFTPMGLISFFMAVLSKPGHIALGLLLLVLLFGDRTTKLNIGKLNPFLKILYNLLILFGLTLIFDMLLYHEWTSMEMLMNSLR